MLEHTLTHDATNPTHSINRPIFGCPSHRFALIRRMPCRTLRSPNLVGYNLATEGDYEPGFKFDKHKFTPGVYVSLTEHDGVMRTFHIASVVEMD
jgi:hypothetical protein